jgi:hypothetical protein
MSETKYFKTKNGSNKTIESQFVQKRPPSWYQSKNQKGEEEKKKKKKEMSRSNLGEAAVEMIPSNESHTPKYSQKSCPKDFGEL